jgi:hypothetical protein
MSKSQKNTDQNDWIDEEIIDRRSAARLIGVGLTTLSRLPIPRMKVRRRVFYLRSKIFEYLVSQTETKKTGG